MSDRSQRRPLPRRGLILGAAMLAASSPSWAIFGVWRRAARRTMFVAGATTAAVVSTEAAAATANAAAANEAAAQSAADASAAAAKQAQAAATQAHAATAQAESPEQKLKELQSLYDQKLISQSDYEAAKKKILSQLTQQVRPPPELKASAKSTFMAMGEASVGAQIGASENDGQMDFEKLN